MSSDAVLDRFPEHRIRILELCRSNCSFAEICSQYSEVVNAIAHLEADLDRHTARTLDELHRQRANLEEELLDVLATHPRS